MRKLLYVAISILVLTTSCIQIGGKKVRGNGVTSSQERSVGNFNRINVSGPIEVLITQGNSTTVKIEGDENLLKYIEVKNDDGELNIKTKRRHNLRPRSALRVHLSAPNYNFFGVAGSGKIRSLTQINNNDELRIEIAGSGTVELKVNVPSIDSEISGSGTVILNGTTRNFKNEINGSGDVRAFNLLSENTELEIAGSGDAEVYASKQLNVKIAGSGDVAYKGNPVVKQSTAGSGNIKKVD